VRFGYAANVAGAEQLRRSAAAVLVRQEVAAELRPLLCREKLLDATPRGQPIDGGANHVRPFQRCVEEVQLLVGLDKADLSPILLREAMPAIKSALEASLELWVGATREQPPVRAPVPAPPGGADSGWFRLANVAAELAISCVACDAAQARRPGFVHAALPSARLMARARHVMYGDYVRAYALAYMAAATAEREAGAAGAAAATSARSARVAALGALLGVLPTSARQDSLVAFEQAASASFRSAMPSVGTAECLTELAAHLQLEPAEAKALVDRVRMDSE